MKEPIVVIIPEILEIFKSNPNPISQAKCLISFKIWKLNVQQNDTIKNLPIKDWENFWKINKSKLLKINNADIEIIAKKFKIPTILFVIDNSDDTCHL